MLSPADCTCLLLPLLSGCNDPRAYHHLVDRNYSAPSSTPFLHSLSHTYASTFQRRERRTEGLHSRQSARVASSLFHRQSGRKCSGPSKTPLRSHTSRTYSPRTAAG